MVTPLRGTVNDASWRKASNFEQIESEDSRRFIKYDTAITQQGYTWTTLTGLSEGRKLNCRRKMPLPRSKKRWGSCSLAQLIEWPQKYQPSD